MSNHGYIALCRYLAAMTLPARLFAGVFAVLVMGLAGCTEDAGRSEVPAPMPQSQSGVQAMYGINAQVSFTGDPGDLAESAMVYVFLREPGNRMPLAVQQFPASDLPRGLSFSSASEGQGDLELVARLSFSGRVDRSAEDLEAVRTVAGYHHPPQSYAMVLGSNDGPNDANSGPVDSAPAHGSGSPVAKDADSPAVSVAISTLIEIASPHQFPPDTVVFVVGRQPGQSMPSLVRRMSLADLPAKIELTDADAMSFRTRISDLQRLDLYARVSTTGSAAVSESDWVSDTVPLEMGALPEQVALTINRPVDD